MLPPDEWYGFYWCWYYLDEDTTLMAIVYAPIANCPSFCHWLVPEWIRKEGVGGPQ